jgi:hypothetical protein
MNYTVEMGSGAMIYNLKKIGSGFRKLLVEYTYKTHTHRQQGDFISLLLFLQNKESRLKPK